jgi:hypothetical protein
MENLEANIEFNVTCHANGCENSGHTISVVAITEDTYFQCGPCGNEIEDVIPVG